MNRTFLIFLMIGTAMMIAVIGQKPPVNDLNYQPWDVDHLESGSIRVFGLSLGKTTIQEANQIFASFADTQLITVTNDDNTQTHHLLASYDELSIGGLLADIQLRYQLDQETLQLLYDSNQSSASAVDTRLESKIDITTEMSYLNTPIASISYIPSIDYDESTIRQHFGQPTEETQDSEDSLIWFYPDLGLHIYIHTNKPDRFVYSPLK